MVCAWAALMSYYMQTRVTFALILTPETCDSYIFCSVIYDLWHVNKEQLKEPSALLSPLWELDDEWNLILQGAWEAWVSQHGKFTMRFKKFSLAFRALRRTRYMREGCSCRNDVIVACQGTSIASDLSLLSCPLLSCHRFTLKCQFRKA